MSIAYRIVCLIYFLGAINCFPGSKLKNLKENGSAECKIHIKKDLGKIEPLIIIPGTTQFVLPHDNTGTILADEGVEFELYCHNNFYRPRISSSQIFVKCSSDNKFTHDNVKFDFVDFECYSKFPLNVARRTSRQCFNNSLVVEIGFEVEDRFLKIFEICHNELSEQTYYTSYELLPASSHIESGVSRPSFKQGDFFKGKNIDSLYVQQISILSSIIGSESLANSYINKSTEVYLARGHITAMADFIFAPHQIATFWFINVAPQWQSFNAHNWVAVEDASRKLAGDRHITLEVYTGTYGIITLRDEHNVEHEIFLDPVKRKVPVPKIYYKILINKSDNSGIVLIGVNNPHLSLEEIKRDYIVCPDVSAKIDYVKWKRDNIYYGYCYACSVNDFVKAVPHINLKVKKLLV